MMNSNYLLLLIAAVVLSANCALADTVYVASDIPPGEGNLNTAITDNINNLNNTVFKLEAAGIYILSATVTVPIGQHLTIVGPEPGTTQATAPAQILWTSSSAPDTRFNFDCNGDITMKHLWLYYGRTDGSQVGSSLEIEDNGTGAQNGYFEDVIFDYSPCPQNSAGAIGVTAPHFRGTFRNCYFRNCTDTHFRYYGRAVSFPFGTTGWHIDSLSFTNCTFANIGYVYMQEGGEYADHVSFNHCTFLNTVMFTLESSWWWWLSITNCVYQNAYMFGDIISQRGGGQYPNGGAITIDSISTFNFSVPFTETDRHILFAHNSYFIEQWLRDYMQPHTNVYTDTATESYLPHPQPMMNERTRYIFDTDGGWPYASQFNNYDSTNPNFLLAPTNVDRIKIFLVKKWTDNSDMSWAFDTATAVNGVWPLSENLRVSNAALRSAGMGGFPLGDLYRWDRSKYNAWLAQEATENAAIQSLLTTPAFSQQTIIGWNMLSAPFLANDMRRITLYPGTTVAYDYSPATGYTSRDTLRTGVGYWMKFPSVQGLSFTGTAFGSDTLDVVAGWNLLGMVSYPALTSDVLTLGGTSVASPYYGYVSTGYYAEDTLRPGLAYWVKCSAAGQLVLRAASSAAPTTSTSAAVSPGSLTAPVGASLPPMNSLTVRDAAGDQRTVYVAAAPTDGDLDRYELPPPAPSGLDVRFASQRFVEGARPGATAAQRVPLLISGATFPVTLSWNVAAGSSPTLLEIVQAGKAPKEVAFTGEGTVTLDAAADIRLRMDPAGEAELPKEFALQQNYPNPFNPSTVIAFAVPRTGLVSLRVFDLLGREVSTLVNRVLEPGTYTATLDGAGLPSGVYLYRLQAQGISLMRKLVLMK